MQTQNLQIIPKGVKPVIRASQFDVGREFELKLYDGASAYTPPAGTTLRLDGVKPDGTVFSYTENLSLSGSTITVTTTTQMTLVKGVVSCEIRMTNGNTDVGTIDFDLIVEESPINENTDLSETEVPALVTLARIQMENAEAWAVGTKDGEPVSEDDPQYQNSAKYWANQVGGQTQDAEAWAVGTKDGVPVTSEDDQYHNNSKYYSEQASESVQGVETYALKSEGYALGKQNGTDVTSESPYYHNNASYFADQAGASATSAGNAADRAEAAVVKEPYIGANGNWFVYNFDTSAYVDTNVAATGPAGADGQDGQDGAPGATGNGIVSITKTGTSGLVDTYTILYTNGQSTTFTVTNGQNGTGAGDMLASDYDPTSAVYNAGGIVAYVAAQISGFSTSLSGLSDVALSSLANGESLIYDATAGKWKNGNIAYSSLSGTPTLGSAAAKNVPSSGNASTTEVVMGDDTRLSDSRPASDVSSWAKAANKPTYSASEITYGANSNVNAEIQTLTQKIGTTTTKTLAANATSIEFDVPTSGTNLIKFYSSDGSFYTAIDTSVSGKATLTFEASASARTISCQIAQA